MLRLDRLAANAFRTLALPSGASQEAIDAAARKMRVLADAQSIPASPGDMEWLGPVSRSRADIEQALARLNDPIGRVEERFLWLHHPENRNLTATAGELLVAATQSPDPTARHDAVVLLLYAAVKPDPKLLDPNVWRNALIAADSLAECDDYARAIGTIERNGDFEKQARLDEIESAAHALPEAVLDLLMSRTDAALDGNDFDVCQRASTVLIPIDGAAGRLDALLHEARDRLLNKLEDLIDRRCRLTVDEVAARIVCDRKKFARQKKKNHKVTRELAAEYNRSIHPVLTVVSALCQDAPRLQRIHSSAARAMRQLGIAWVWSGQWIAADNTFAAAETLAAGTPFITSIQQARAENATRAFNKRTGKKSTSSARLGWAAFILIGMVIRGLTSISSNNSTYTAPDTPMRFIQPRDVGVNQNPVLQHPQENDHYSDIVKKFQEEDDRNRTDSTKTPYIPPLSLRNSPASPSISTPPPRTPAGDGPHH